MHVKQQLILQFINKRSKTEPYACGVTVHIEQATTPHSPVSAVLEYLVLAQPSNKLPLYFIFLLHIWSTPHALQADREDHKPVSVRGRSKRQRLCQTLLPDRHSHLGSHMPNTWLADQVHGPLGEQQYVVLHLNLSSQPSLHCQLILSLMYLFSQLMQLFRRKKLLSTLQTTHNQFQAKGFFLIPL